METRSHLSSTRSWSIGKPLPQDGGEPGERESLQRAISAAPELISNLLCDLTVVQKMEYHRTWEIATREWTFLPDERDQPHLSFDPAMLDSQQSLPVFSA